MSSKGQHTYRPTMNLSPRLDFILERKVLLDDNGFGSMGMLRSWKRNAWGKYTCLLSGRRVSQIVGTSRLVGMWSSDVCWVWVDVDETVLVSGDAGVAFQEGILGIIVGVAKRGV